MIHTHHDLPADPVAIEREKERAFHEMIRRDTHGADPASIEMFRGIMKVSAMITSLADKHLARFGLTMAKMRLLFLLHYRGSDKGLLPSELSKFQGVMPNTVTSLVNSLRASGLIEQIEHIHDKRKRLIRITDAGRNLIKQVGPEHIHFVETLFEELSPDLREQMAHGLGSLTDKLITLHADSVSDHDSSVDSVNNATHSADEAIETVRFCRPKP